MFTLLHQASQDFPSDLNMPAFAPKVKILTEGPDFVASTRSEGREHPGMFLLKGIIWDDPCARCQA
jgi:hypothetical protein